MKLMTKSLLGLALCTLVGSSFAQGNSVTPQSAADAQKEKAAVEQEAKTKRHDAKETAVKAGKATKEAGSKAGDAAKATTGAAVK
jgi:hypothetical protein